MPRQKTTQEPTGTRRGRPAMDPSDREKQLIALSMDQAEKQLREGTASSQIIVHFLKLATINSELERDKLRMEIKASEAKIESMKRAEASEKIYADALNAMKRYSGEVSANEELQ